MKKNTLFLLLLPLFLGIRNPATAQSASIDVVTMKGGKIYKGKILSYVPGRQLVLQQDDGQRLELQDADISKILQGAQQGDEATEKKPTSKRNGLPSAKTRGLYGSSMLSFAMGGSDSEGLALGAGFSQVVGYQITKAFGVGVGIGVDNYSRRGDTVYPLFAEVRNFLPSTSNTGNFYLTAGGGYSLAFPRESLEITSAKGGPMGQFAFGYRATTVEGVDIFVDLGAKFQAAQFERTLYNGDTEMRDIEFRRVVIRVGIGL